MKKKKGKKIHLPSAKAKVQMKELIDNVAENDPHHQHSKSESMHIYLNPLKEKSEGY